MVQVAPTNYSISRLRTRGGGLLRSVPILNSFNFKSVEAMNFKFNIKKMVTFTEIYLKTILYFFWYDLLLLSHA